mmetsp:Transcript_17587/g.24941  ORF Transcript_17587/g.24941 Transcript_17587/m.24941 type:complete len:142 (-) Transcript_17587:186-611(-)
MSIIPSKPIPIPRRREDDPNDEMIMTPREATEVYDAATWRMFELITSARLRAARNFHNKVLLVDDDYPSSPRHVMMSHHDHDDVHNAAVTVAGKSSQLVQQLDEVTQHHRDRVFSLPEPTSSSLAPPTSSTMDEVFPMDSL